MSLEKRDENLNGYYLKKSNNMAQDAPYIENKFYSIY